MNMRKEDKLISLMKFWPRGAVLTSEWLIHVQGYSKGLLQQYRRSGWIELVGKGAYRRVELDEKKNIIPLHWRGGLYALQAVDISNLSDADFPNLHVAARTALELAGYAHFLNLSKKENIWIFAEPKYRVPTWFKNYKWGAKLNIYSPKLFSKKLPSTISDKDAGPFITKISCPERAIMELLELCPKEESLEHAKLVMESLATLRPKVVSELLQYCTSIKVKRLFLALADLCNHEWLKEIDTKKIDLGTGSRILEPGQNFHTKYRITIPKEESA